LNKPFVINKVAEQLGLTSRTLRHWESENLFSSTRAVDSGWRTYDEYALVNLMGTARLFGGNMKPFPSSKGKPYGYGFCASVPYGVTITDHLKEMTLPGGLFAVLDSTDDISVSWQTLMNCLSDHDKYKSDRSRLCLEEHIRNDNPEGSGNEYSLRLMEPIMVK
jgi:hypothetical protein